jgi:hypothetical protein
MSFVSLSGYVTRVSRAAPRFDRGIAKTGMVCRFSIQAEPPRFGPGCARHDG